MPESPEEPLEEELPVLLALSTDPLDEDEPPSVPCEVETLESSAPMEVALLEDVASGGTHVPRRSAPASSA